MIKKKLGQVKCSQNSVFHGEIEPFQKKNLKVLKHLLVKSKVPTSTSILGQQHIFNDIMWKPMDTAFQNTLIFYQYLSYIM